MVESEGVFILSQNKEGDNLVKVASEQATRDRG